ncbi:MAG: 30S ribosomal protein S3 [Prevotellaceae bacterium]|jgi:small subunit ribosomal protein S3|nr:30S ribosomal protein S3 [Prevotellaceae bacterium]
MGQKTNPISNRLGIIRGWDSNWYGGDNYGDTLVEDSKIRKYINIRLAKAGLSRIVIERTLKLVTITVCAARPGFIIGRGGEDVDKLKEELKKITDKDIDINIFEVKKPELDAQIVANNAAKQIESKVAYRRAVKLAIAGTIKAGAEGIKIQVSGRLNGAEIARSEMFKEGRTPLHTFRADIDYCHAEALTKVGIIGIKVWICRGEVYGKRDLSPNFVSNKEGNFGGGRYGGRDDRRNDRRGGGRGDDRRRSDRRGGGRDNRSERREGGDRKGGFRKKNN